MFDQRSVQGHTSCVTEHEKYAQGATKPGGFAEKGFFGDGAAAAAGEPAAGAAEGLEFLSARPPWKCSICNVACTSQETLMGHASGAKHKRRARAALAARNGAGEAAPAPAAQNGGAAEEKKEEEDAGATNGNGAAAAAAAEKTSDDDSGSDGGEKKKKEEKKGKKKEKEVKWKKLAAAELKRSGGSMKAKKLLKAVLAAAGVDHDGDAVMMELEKSKKFKVEGKTVSLTA